MRAALCGRYKCWCQVEFGINCLTLSQKKSLNRWICYIKKYIYIYRKLMDLVTAWLIKPFTLFAA